MEEPQLGELRRLGLDRAGVDHLCSRFYAATSCSPTHLAWIVVSGRVRAVSGNQTFLLEGGDVFLSPAGTAHSVELLSPKAEGCWFHFRTEPRWSHFSAQTHRMNAGLSLQLHGAMRQLIAESTTRGAFREQMMERLAGVMAVILMREIQTAATNLSTAILERRLESLWEKIRAALAEDWTVARMAAQLHVSPSYLHKLTLKLESMRPMQKVVQLRMELARGLLENTYLTLDEIAERTGYASAYAFSNAYHRTTGERPGTFRRRVTG